MPILGIVLPNMGTKRRPSSKALVAGSGLADALFSVTQQRVLGLLFGQPERSYYATELIGLAHVGSGAVQRELARLTRSGLVTVSAIGNRKHFQANANSPLYAELCGIAQKTMGLAEPLREALRRFETDVDAAFVYGSVAKGTDSASSDIDIMLITDTLTYGDVFAALESTSASLGRRVNPTILSRKELSKRVKADSAFFTRVLSGAKVWLFGGMDALGVGESVRAE
jgi:predicted nucleotidyltransferase